MEGRRLFPSLWSLKQKSWWIEGVLLLSISPGISCQHYICYLPSNLKCKNEGGKEQVLCSQHIHSLALPFATHHRLFSMDLTSFLPLSLPFHALLPFFLAVTKLGQFWVLKFPFPILLLPSPLPDLFVYSLHSTQLKVGFWKVESLHMMRVFEWDKILTERKREEYISMTGVMQMKFLLRMKLNLIQRKRRMKSKTCSQVFTSFQKKKFEERRPWIKGKWAAAGKSYSFRTLAPQFYYFYYHSGLWEFSHLYGERRKRKEIY